MTYHFDIKRITADAQAFDLMLSQRGYRAPVALASMAQKIVEVNDRRRQALNKAQTSQAEINTLSQQIGKAIKANAGGLAEQLKDKVRHLKSIMEIADYDAKTASSELEGLLLTLPNWPADDVPEGRGEAQNVVQSTWGTPGPAATAHWDMDVDLGQDLAAQISGSRFSMLQGPVARLHRALGQMMMDQHARTGYQEVVPPTIVRSDALYGTGQLPKFEDDLYGLVNQQDEDVCDLYLIPTAEVSLTNIHAGRLEVILEGTKFPTHRYVALTECYRAEAGSAGRDTRGLIRQHQFQKVEMVVVCDPQDAAKEHQRMLEGAEGILRALHLPYRRVLLCRGDMGFSARKTYDLEVWMPGQNAYREISSISDCGDFQARRMDSRFKRGKEILFPHTLNGSGVAVGRALAAVLENHQTQDGDVLIPEALRPYMLGATLLSQLN